MQASPIYRLWRPAARRNLRNQWSLLSSCRQRWSSSSSTGRSHAISLVNTFLGKKYMSSMQLGVLSDMQDIREKACYKLSKRQELFGKMLLSSYKEMVTYVVQMTKLRGLMRCYSNKTIGSPLVQFSSTCMDETDAGDGGNIPVFKFWSISDFEHMAEELVQMFTRELQLKRLLVAEFLYLGSNCPQGRERWLKELYPGEYEDLSSCNLYSKDGGPTPPKLFGRKCSKDYEFTNEHSRETLEVYITAWLAEVNVDTHRVEEIFDMVGEEMQVSFS